MSYAVIRMQKIKNPGALGRHIDRSSEGDISIPINADSERVGTNIHWDKSGKSYSQEEWSKYSAQNPLSKRINDEINERYSVDKKIRKDAVKAVEYIFTSDTIKMNEIFNDEKLYRSWVKDNKDYLCNVFGKENIISMHLHLDEQTPHMHAIIVPITKDGRLSCKSFINGKKDLSQQQSDYAEVMKKYGMERGQLGSSAKHQRVNSNINNKYINYDRN
ncbi:Plasmid recombination enzyme [Tenacibaculum sp. MAR_2009_124]|uniref:MobV family relaxase n=1 Tax=Tenacibaculum sp. MAR_2009_124 TaxID=1250059 RepID=UPI00089D51CB|nr:MobV family relaxase [Tenacibaculum sp. MAR_2009_124]SEB51444.1 Plasmid recombination enzyme [Tenacibaculum sp. MAR_2009_124]